jgi:hypothetical protein
MIKLILCLLWPNLNAFYKQRGRRGIAFKYS